VEKTIRGGSAVAIGISLLLIGFWIFARAMERDLNHDEHQFIAPGALLAREGLLPYRDYPLFHFPNLALVYGAVGTLCSSPIVAGKIVSIASTWIVASLIFACAYASIPSARHPQRLVAGFAAVSFFLFDPVFAYTAGKLWNHEFPTALAVLCLLLFVRSRNDYKLLTASGLCLGIAIGSRLTFAPLLLPFLVFLFLDQRAVGSRLRLGLLFCGGVGVGLLPTAATFYLDPEAFLFGNLEFPRLRLLDPENSRIHKTMTVRAKVRYFAKEIVLPSWPLFLAFAAVAVKPGIGWFRTHVEERFGAAVCVAAVPFIVFGCFLPSRYQYQHFFALVPFLVLGVVFWFRAAHHSSNRVRTTGLGLLALISISVSVWTTVRKNGWRGYSWIANSTTPSKWFPSRAHELPDALRLYVPGGKVLTLASAWPLEAGLSIYPEFATGPFAWRSARFVSPERRARFKLIAPADLERFLNRDRPAAILTGMEDRDLEAPFVQYASEHRYRAVKLPKKRTLWLAPAAADAKGD
jgi:hypothetical protein